MKITDAPLLITTPFAQNGTRNDIPVTSEGIDTGRASFTTGFPDETMKPITAGGTPPKGADFNGILYALTNAARFYGAGGHYQFNGSFASAIGGYPMGATVQASDNMGHWLNVVEANSTGPESGLSTGWLPLADHNGTATVNVGGNTTLTPLQAAKANIRFTGSPAGNSTITFPAWTKRYSIINDCAGDQSLICTTGNGESISIKNGAKYEIGCDGKNLTVATVNASQVFAEPNKNVSSLEAPTVQQIINALGAAASHGFFDTGDAEKIPYGYADAASTGCVAVVRDAAYRRVEELSISTSERFSKLGNSSAASVFDGDYGITWKYLPFLGTRAVVSTGALRNIIEKLDNDIFSRLHSSAFVDIFDTGDAASVPYGASMAASTGCVAAIRDESNSKILVLKEDMDARFSKLGSAALASVVDSTDPSKVGWGSDRVVSAGSYSGLFEYAKAIKDSMGAAATHGFYDTGDANQVPYGDSMAASTGCVAAVRDQVVSDIRWGEQSNPVSWHNGEYMALKDNVISAIQITGNVDGQSDYVYFRYLQKKIGGQWVTVEFV